MSFYLAKVEVNKVLRLVGDVGAEVSADDAVPGGAEKISVKLFQNDWRESRTLYVLKFNERKWILIISLFFSVFSSL